MTSDAAKPSWRVIGRSVRGAAHVRTDLPNQDAIGWSPQSGSGPPVLLALSDGHGGARHFRSDVGAHLAVQTIQAVVEEFLRNSREVPSLSTAKRWAEEQLPREIVRRWREAVADHLSTNPIDTTALDRLDAAEGASRRRQVALEPVVAYGATLLGVLVTESYILYIQLGDGDIVTVAESGEVSRPPVPGDERLIANETTSLCTAEAWREFRLFFQVIAGSIPALVLVSTDGYANSFQDESGFLSVGSDLLRMIQSASLDAVDKQIEAWLSEASEQGSGDDISLGILCHIDVLETADGPGPSDQISAFEEEASCDEARAEADPKTEVDDAKSELTTLKPEASAEDAS